MQKIDQEITRFSSNLTHLHKVVQNNSEQCSVSQNPTVKEDVPDEQQVLNNSPLVEGDGADKRLKLLFDLSQFDPEEVKVTILEDILLVEASHVEKTSTCTIYREYARQVQLPKGLNPDTVTSALSRDGVLTVQAPLGAPERNKKAKIKDRNGKWKLAQLHECAASSGKRAGPVAMTTRRINTTQTHTCENPGDLKKLGTHRAHRFLYA
ncbi:unnamed protein product, partial [Iphiclides podalirius]